MLLEIEPLSGQGQSLSSNPKIQECGPHASTDLPAGPREIPPRRLREMLSLCCAVAALAEGLKDEVHDWPDRKWSGAGNRSLAKDIRKIKSGIRALAGDDDACLRAAELSVRYVQIRMIVNRGERERREFPGWKRTRLPFTVEAHRNKLLQARIV